MGGIGMVTLAILLPFFGIAYLIWQIQRRDLRGWQHYACVTSLFVLTSLLLLIAGGRTESFGLAGNTVKLVDQKLDRIEALTEQNKRIARSTVELVIQASSGAIMSADYDGSATLQNATNLLKAAGLSDAEISRSLAKGQTLHESHTQLAQTIR